MIEVQVPKNIDDYEATLIGPLTGRQAVCFAVAAGVEFLYFNIISSLEVNISMDSKIAIGVILAIPILMLAIWKPFGIRAETYIFYYILPSLIGKKERLYETKNTYDILLDLIDEAEEPAEKKESKKPAKKPKTKGKIDTFYL